MSWGHGTMSNGARYDGPMEHMQYIDAIQNTRSWLDSGWSEEKQKVFDDLYNFGAFGWYPMRDKFDRELNARNNAAYMGRYSVNYADIKDPRKLSSTSVVTGALHTYNFVSDNVKRLYR